MSTLEKAPVTLERIERLIRKPILFDESEDRYKYPKIKNAIGSHGSHFKSVVNLAEYGKFIGGDKDLSDQFFLSGNPDFPKWAAHGLEDRIKGRGVEGNYDVNHFDRSIEYSQVSRPANQPEKSDDELADQGVVIVFKEVALSGLRDIFFSTEGNPELVLIEAPSIEAIHSIYPVEPNAAQALQRALQELRS